MFKRILCKLTGGHRFHGAPVTFIDKHEIVHYRHTCIKCGKTCEWAVPWINVWRAGSCVDFDKEDEKMPMIDLSIGFDEANGRDPAGTCVLCRDDKGEAHIQNLILGEKAELIYKLLTTLSSEYSIFDFKLHGEVNIQF